MKRKMIIGIIITILIIILLIIGFYIYKLKQGEFLFKVDGLTGEKSTSDEQIKIDSLDTFYSRNETKNHKDIRDLPQDYSIEDAQVDKCFIIGAMVHNDYLYNEFIDKYNKRETAFIRVVQSTTEGDIFLIDLLYDSEKNKIYFVKDDTRDEFSAKEDRNIKLNTYEKTGIWNYQSSEYWVVYNGELPSEVTESYSNNTNKLFIITKIN